MTLCVTPDGRLILKCDSGGKETGREKRRGRETLWTFFPWKTSRPL